MRLTSVGTCTLVHMVPHRHTYIHTVKNKTFKLLFDYTHPIFKRQSKKLGDKKGEVKRPPPISAL